MSLALLSATAYGHSVGQVQAGTYLAPESAQLVRDRAGSGAAGFVSGDEITFIIEFTPVENGATLGAGGYVTAYIPDGMEVIDAAIVKPSGGSFIEVAPNPPGGTPGGWGPQGQKTFVVAPWTDPNYDPACAGIGAGLCNGSMAQIYADTGIFYSTDPRTEVFFSPDTDGIIRADTTLGGAGNGYAIDPTGEGQLLGLLDYDDGLMHNIWDADNANAFGSTAIPTRQPASSEPPAGNGGRGVTPYNAGSPVAGPDTGYQLDNTGNVGPWQRISYQGSRTLAPAQKCPAVDALNSCGPAGLSVVYGSNTSDGVSLSSISPLPTNTNAIRWAIGRLQVGEVTYVSYTVRLTQTPGADGLITNTEVYGGDAAGDDSNKDSVWRYAIPSVGYATTAMFARKSVIAVDGEPSTGTVLPNGDYVITYQIEYLNTGVSTQTNIQISDLLPIETCGTVTNIVVVDGPDVLPTNPTAPTGDNFDFANIPVLPAGEGGIIQLDVPICGNGGVALNQLDVVSDQLEFAVTSSAATSFVGNPIYDMTKTVTPSTVLAGETVRYTFSIENIGGSIGENLTVNDFLPTHSQAGDASDIDLRFSYVLGTSVLKHVTNAGVETTLSDFPAVMMPPIHPNYFDQTNREQLVWTPSVGLDVNEKYIIEFDVIVGADIPFGGDVFFNEAIVQDSQGDHVQAGMAPVTIEEPFPAISGRLFEDVNNNGVYDQGVDTPVSNVTVTNDFNANVVETNDDGFYRMPLDGAGDRTVFIDQLDLDLPLDLYRDEAVDFQRFVSVPLNETVEGIDFPLRRVEPNPDFNNAACIISQDIILALDASGAVNAASQAAVRSGVTDYLNSLLDRNARVAIVEYQNSARTLIGYTDVTAANISGTFATALNDYHSVVGSEATNWEAGLNEINALISSTGITPDYTVFFSASDPDRYIVPPDTITSGDAEIATRDAHSAATTLKQSGVHMFSLFVGSSVDNLVFLRSLTDGSTNTQEISPAPATVVQGDLIRATDFSEFGTQLVALSEAACIPPSSDIAITKVANTTTTSEGGSITWTVTVTNESTIDAFNLTIEDRIQSPLSITSGSPSAGTFTVGGNLWQLPELLAGQSATLTVNTSVPIGTDGNSYSNTAELISMDQTDIDSTPGNAIAGEDDQASATINVNGFEPAPEECADASFAIVDWDRIPVGIGGSFTDSRYGLDTTVTVVSNGANSSFTSDTGGFADPFGVEPFKLMNAVTVTINFSQPVLLTRFLSADLDFADERVTVSGSAFGQPVAPSVTPFANGIVISSDQATQSLSAIDDPSDGAGGQGENKRAAIFGFSGAVDTITIVADSANDTQVLTDITVCADFNDAPVATAFHGSVGSIGAPQLGPQITSDEGPYTKVDATDDDRDDGIFISGQLLQGETLLADSTLTLTAETVGAGTLYGFVDWNGDGDFDDELETLPPVTSSGGTVDLVFDSPTTTAAAGYARFRYSNDSSAALPAGFAATGEIEDYAVAFAAPSLAISKIATPDTLVAGETVRYTLTVDNIGAARVEDLIISDFLPTASAEGAAADANLRFSYVAGSSIFTLVDPNGSTVLNITPTVNVPPTSAIYAD